MNPNSTTCSAETILTSTTVASNHGQLWRLKYHAKANSPRGGCSG